MSYTYTDVRAALHIFENTKDIIAGQTIRKDGSEFRENLSAMVWLSFVTGANSITLLAEFFRAPPFFGF